MNVLRAKDLTGIPELPTGHLGADEQTVVELSEDPVSLRKLWGMVLLIAVRDRAASIQYRPWRSDGVLTMLVDGQQYELFPPPSELAKSVVAAARSLFERRRGLISRLAADRRGPASGSFTLDVWGEMIEWDVICWSVGPRLGVEFLRITPTGEYFPDEPL